MSKYSDLIERKQREYGEQFDASDLAKQFVPYFNGGERIKVDFGNGIVKTGTVGVTTGWKPAFLLMLSSRSTGSPWVLTDSDKVIAIKYHGQRSYVA